MGIFRRSFAPVADGAREVKAALDRRFDKPQDPREVTARAAVPLQPGLAPNPPQQPYEIYAREGYSQNDIVYACITALGTSAAEPVMAAYTGKGKSEKQIEDHDVLDLLSRPNRFLSGYQFVYTIIMYRAIAGNVYLEKVRSRAGKVVELWPLRPDRVHILADPDKFIAGYRYQIGGHWWDIPPEDIIHIRTPNPLNDYYGMPPLMPLAGRVDIDNWSRSFVAAFFRNGGVPAGILSLKRPLEDGEREKIQSRFRGEYGGPTGWFNLAVIDLEGAEANFQQAGMPLGERGLVLPELNFISEARIAGAMGVPLSIVGTVLGGKGGSYANRVSDRESFWHETLSPLYKEIGDALTNGLEPEYSDITRLGFDMSTVLALRPDEDKLHDRARGDMASGLISQEEGREMIGQDDPVKPDDVYLIPQNLIPTKGKELLDPAEPQPMGLLPPPGAPGANGQTGKPGANGAAGANGQTRPTGRQGASNQFGAGANGDQGKAFTAKAWMESIDEVKSDAPQLGMMICCYVDAPDLPFDPAEGSLGTDMLPQSDRHITLAYVPDPTPEDVKTAQECASLVAHHLPVPIQVSGVGRFATDVEGGRDPFIALVDSPFLHDMRNELVQHLQRKGVRISTEHAFVPHITLSYLSTEDPTPLPGGLRGPVPLQLDNIAVKSGSAPPVRFEASDFQYAPAGRISTISPPITPKSKKKSGAGSMRQRIVRKADDDQKSGDNGETKEWVPATRR